MTLRPGTRLGPYEIVAPLGAGGMGEVYRARDTRLGRDVAVKVLLGGHAEEPEMRERFEREARAISALSHPAICTLFDVGEQEGTHFLVMEHLEGGTLASRLESGPLPIEQVLEVGAEIARALAAAHRRGIVHRDLKPGNVILTRSGPKLLDFGLAKLHAASHGRAEPGAAKTVSAPLTEQGMLLGTLQYMAPEQLQGREADARCDIFALGCVLYEMASGRKAFSGETQASVIGAILHGEPEPLAALAPLAPAALERLVGACLAKDPEARWQSAGDLAQELAWMRSAPEPRGTPAPAPRRALARLPWAVSAGAAVVAVAAWLAGPGRARPAGPSGSISLTALTVGPGYEGEPTFSPDGRMIAYVSDRAGNLEVYLKQVGGGPDVNLTNNPADDVQPAFSPDGTQIAFVSTRASASDLIYRAPRIPLMGGDVWVMPALGGSARRIAEGGNFPSWTPDGSEVVYVGGPPYKSKVYRVPALGGTPREIPLAIPSEEPGFPILLYPSVSPDGRWLLFSTQFAVCAAPVSGGAATRLAEGSNPVWAPDGTAVLYCNGEPGRGDSLWRVPFDARSGRAAGSPGPLTVGRGRDTQATVARDGRHIAFAAQDVTTELQLVPFDAHAGVAHGDAHTLAAGREFIAFISPSPDGSAAVYEAIRGDGTHIWRADSGSRPVALTSDPAWVDENPRWSPDGSRIAFNRTPVASLLAAGQIWLMGPDGANPRRVSAAGGQSAWMPDGRSLLVARNSSLSRLDLGTGSETRLDLGAPVMPIFNVSADGAWVAFQASGRDSVDIMAAPLGGGPPRLVVATPKQDFHPSFAPSGRWLYFQEDHKNIYRIPGPAQGWRAAPPERVTSFPESNLYLEDPRLSADGRWLAFSRVKVASTLWLLELPAR